MLGRTGTRARRSEEYLPRIDGLVGSVARPVPCNSPPSDFSSWDHRPSLVPFQTLSSRISQNQAALGGPTDLH